MPPSLARFTNTLVFTQAILVILHLLPERHQVPRGPLPVEGVTLVRVQFTHTSEGVTPLSSLLWPHAPILKPLFSSCCSTCKHSLCWLSPPSWQEDFPVVISAHLSVDARTPIPAPALVPLVVSSQSTSAFPATVQVGVAQHPCSNFRRGKISGLQYSLISLLASTFACDPGCSDRRQHLCLGHCRFYIRAERGSLPPHASDMLAVRIDQLTAHGLSPR